MLNAIALSAISQNHLSNNLEKSILFPTFSDCQSSDVITGLQGGDVLTGDDGNDEFVYTSLLDAGDTITDFAVGFDTLVLTQLLESVGYVGENAVADKYVRFVAAGSGTMVEIDPDGVLERGVFRPLLRVENVGVAALSDVGNFGF
jgi:hypothetical protein